MLRGVAPFESAVDLVPLLEHLSFHTLLLFYLRDVLNVEPIGGPEPMSVVELVVNSRETFSISIESRRLRFRSSRELESAETDSVEREAFCSGNLFVTIPYFHRFE